MCLSAAVHAEASALSVVVELVGWICSVVLLYLQSALLQEVARVLRPSGDGYWCPLPKRVIFVWCLLVPVEVLF